MQANAQEHIKNVNIDEAKIMATYSPEDNKLRIYVNEYLSIDELNEFKGEGFLLIEWSDCFVAPGLTAGRVALCLKYAGSIGEHKASLAERGRTPLHPDAYVNLCDPLLFLEYQPAE